MDRNAKLPGTPLTSAQFKKVPTTSWAVKADYHWDAGVALSRFLDGLKEGRLWARGCRSCGRVVVPPRMFCEWCFRPNDEWLEVRDKGTVNTFSVSFVNWDATRRKSPEVPAVIDIEGCSPGVGLLHKLGEVGNSLELIRKRARIGMKVKAVWKPGSERTGEITDILYFKPVR